MNFYYFQKTSKILPLLSCFLFVAKVDGMKPEDKKLSSKAMPAKASSPQEEELDLSHFPLFMGMRSLDQNNIQEAVSHFKRSLEKNPSPVAEACCCKYNNYSAEIEITYPVGMEEYITQTSENFFVAPAFVRYERAHTWEFINIEQCIELFMKENYSIYYLAILQEEVIKKTSNKRGPLLAKILLEHDPLSTFETSFFQGDFRGLLGMYRLNKEHLIEGIRVEKLYKMFSALVGLSQIKPDLIKDEGELLWKMYEQLQKPPLNNPKIADIFLISAAHFGHPKAQIVQAGKAHEDSKAFFWAFHAQKRIELDEEGKIATSDLMFLGKFFEEYGSLELSLLGYKKAFLKDSQNQDANKAYGKALGKLGYDFDRNLTDEGRVEYIKYFGENNKKEVLEKDLLALKDNKQPVNEATKRRDQDCYQIAKEYDALANKTGDDTLYEKAVAHYKKEVTGEGLLRLDAAYRLFCLHYDKKAKSLKDKAALGYLKIAEEGGSSGASFFLGLLHFKGELGLDKNTTEGLKYFKKAEDKGYDYYFNLGALYQAVSEEIGNEALHEKAVAFYKKGSERGDSRASFFLSQIYNKGEQVLKDNEQSLYYLDKAANGGYEYYDSIGLEYYTLADEKGDGALYEKAFEFYKKEIEKEGKGSVEAALGMHRLWKDKKVNFQNAEEEVLKCLEAVASKEDTGLLNILGALYKTRQEFEKSAEYFRRSGNLIELYFLEFVTSYNFLSAEEQDPIEVYVLESASAQLNKTLSKEELRNILKKQFQGEMAVLDVSSESTPKSKKTKKEKSDLTAVSSKKQNDSDEQKKSKKVERLLDKIDEAEAKKNIKKIDFLSIISACTKEFGGNLKPSGGGGSGVHLTIGETKIKFHMPHGRDGGVVKKGVFLDTLDIIKKSLLQQAYPF